MLITEINNYKEKAIVVYAEKLVWVRLGIESRFPDFQSGMLTTTPRHTSFNRIGHFSHTYKLVLNAVMMIMFIVTLYRARRSKVSITS